MTRVLFVCLGNICRSPMAEGIFRQLVKEADLQDRFVIDSAGTGGWHVGEPPDPRAQQIMKQFGAPISDLRARQFRSEDFDKFDLILAMDESNKRDILQRARKSEDEKKVHLMMSYDPKSEAASVPDPYYDDEQGFERVYYMLYRSCNNLLETLKGKDQ